MASFSPYPPHFQEQQQHLFPPLPPFQQQQEHHSVPNPNGPPPSVVATPAAAAATLLVRHLPEAIPHDMLSRLFSHYGASSVRPCAGGKLRNCAFVDFKNEALASQAQAQLNRLKFLGKVLTVERIGSNTKNTNSQNNSEVRRDTSGPTSLLKDSSDTRNSVYGGEPIAPRLGVDYPFPPHLEYAYPPPDGNILTNIVNALIAVPRFYTQVLHLMNKMNLPAPFRMALPTPPLPPQVPAPPLPPPPVTVEPSSSSDESELESSEDIAGDNHIKKRVKRESIVGPAIDKGVAHEAVGLKPVSLVPKEVSVIKKKNPVLQIKIAPKRKLKDIFDDGNNIKELTDPVEEQVEQKPYAMPEDIEKGKLPPEEILSLPMFKTTGDLNVRVASEKDAQEVQVQVGLDEYVIAIEDPMNYTAGSPAMVLYIKNLAKDVVADDFYFIFGSLFESLEAAKSGLHIKLMQEGRMRGQAFVTFPSIGLAQRALNLVNGYVFKGKPMIIQFGRNPTAGKTM